MQEFKQAMAGHQPMISDALARHIAELPAAAQPAANHVFSAGGKRLRPFLTVMTGRAFNCFDPALYSLGTAVEMLHAATLLHDDILDNASLRRGRPSAHTIFAKTPVILAGDALLAKAVLAVSSYGDSRLTDCVSLAVMRTAEGEILEFDRLRDPDLSSSEYLDMITGKTAWMLRASCELGALYAGASPEQTRHAANFGLELGIAFQMVDDALDVLPSELTGKPRGGDIKEGKVTPPLRLYIDSLSPKEAAGFKSRFAAGPLSDEDADALSQIICSGGFVEQTRHMAGKHLALASAALQEWPDAPERVVLSQMLSYIGKRDR